jgi:hypothetical protein
MATFPARVVKPAHSQHSQDSNDVTAVIPAGEVTSLPARTDVGRAEELDKIRDILFGGQMGELEHRMVLLEQQLRGHVRKEIEAIERHLKSEVTAITDWLNAEQRDRKAGHDDLSDRVSAVGRSIDGRIAEVEDKAERRQSALREQILSHSNLLSDTIQQRNDELSKRLAEGLAELRSAKADRDALAGVLIEIGTRLRSDHGSH